MASLGTLTVFLGLNNRQLNRGAAESERRLGTLRNRMNQVATRATAMSGAVVAAGAAYVTHLVRDGLRAIDTNNKLAVSLRGTYDELRAVRIAADDAGIDGLDQSLTRLNRRLGAAEMGTGQAVDTLDRMGLSARELADMGLDERIAAIADAIQATGMTAQEAQRHLQQLGFTQAEAVEFFMQGGDAIRAARQEVDDFGLSVSQIDAAQIEAANDSMSRIGRVIEGIRNQITIALAPLLGALADRFNDVARANQGFGQQAANAAETALTAFGRVGDVIQGLRVAAGGMQLAVSGLQTGFIALATSINQGLLKVLEMAARGVTTLIETANFLPLVNIDTSGIENLTAKLSDGSDRMGEMRRNAVESTRRIASELHDLAMQEMPSDRIAGFIDDIRERAEEAAAEIADSRSQMFAGGDAAGDPAEEAQHREHLEKRLERLREQNLSELELAEERHDQHLELLREAMERELITEQEFADQKERTEQQHMDELARIREAGMTELDRITAASMREQASFVASGFADMTASAARGNRAMFELNKTAALASAALDMKEAITGAYKVGARIGGPPLGAAYAATAGAAQLATLNNIRSQSFDSGGGGAAPSVSQTPAPPVSPVGGGQEQGGGQGGNGGESRTLTVRNLGGGFIQQLAEELLEFQRDGGRVVFDS